MSVRVGVVTVSDRCSRGEMEDRSGPAVRDAVRAQGWEVVRDRCVPDEIEAVSSALREWSEGEGALDLILTIGGTGLGPRDRTPEATRAVLDKELPGVAERMRREGERSAPTAALSRCISGARDRSLIFNLPGSPRGARESLEAVAGLVSHALEMMRGGGHGEAGS